MDCIEAQRIISEALDKVPVDDVSVEKAKLHCAGCADCSAFVRSIATAMRAGLPDHDPGLPDRVMTAVRADAEARAVAQAAALPRATAAAEHSRPGPSLAAEAPAAPQTASRGTVVNLRDPATRRSLAIWASAAAVVLVAAGMFANQGVRQILQPTDTTVLDTQIGGMPGEERALAPGFGALESTGTTGDAGGATGSTLGESAPAAKPGDYIAVNGIAYVRAGTVPDVNADELSVIGATSSALDSNGAVVSVDVLGGQDPSRAYVEKPDGTLLAFDRVSREYQGRQYALQTGTIERFGSWPTYPGGVGKPTSDDGSPVFRELGSDGTGARLFEPVAGGPAIGIAVAPASPASDPAAGNPDWTWWVPIR